MTRKTARLIYSTLTQVQVDVVHYAGALMLYLGIVVGGAAIGLVWFILG